MSVAQTPSTDHYLPAGPHASKRRPRKHCPPQRETRFVAVSADDTAGDWLGRLPVPGQGETVVGYLCGDLPADVERLRAIAHDPPDGWVEGDHYLPRVADPVLRYTHIGTGGSVELHRATIWFPKADASDPQACADAWSMLRDAIRAVWRHDELPMLTTPAAMGRDLWLRTIPRDVEWPTLPDETQRLIRATSGQGRWQHPSDPHLAGERRQLPALVRYDLRFGYAGMMSNLPVGPWVHDDRPDWSPQMRGRFRVAVTVPDGWQHVGLLPWPDPEGGWRYPNTPGERFETWADGAELAIAHRHGWPLEVCERIVGQPGKPLDRFVELLVRGRAGSPSVRQRLLDQYREAPQVAKLAADGARAIVLHMLGAMHGRPRPVTRSVPEHRVAEMPADAHEPRLRAGRWEWTEHEAPAMPETAHPEWTTAVWARCRARMLDHRGTGALHVPYRDVLAIHQDAIYLAADPQWEDDGKVGSPRRELAAAGPWPAPADRAALNELADRAVGEGPCRACRDHATRFPPDGSKWCDGCFPGWQAWGQHDPTEDARAYARERARAAARARTHAPNAGAREEPTQEAMV